MAAHACAPVDPTPRGRVVSAPVTPARGSRRALAVVLLLVAAIVGGVLAGRSHAPGGSKPVAPVDAAQVPAAGALSTAWYCPGLPPSFPTADQSVTLTNLGSNPAEVIATVYPDNGSAAVARSFVIGRESVMTLDRSTLQVRAKSTPTTTTTTSTTATSTTAAGGTAKSGVPDGPLVVEPFSSDVMVSAGLESADALATVPCATTTATDWYFAAGTTVRGASQWLVLDDPFAADARVDITLRTDAGVQVLPSLTGLDVPGRARVIIPIQNEAVRRARVSVEVHASVGRVVASQTLQFGSASGPQGVATSIGAVAPSSAWWFTDGDTRTGAVNVVAIADVGELDARVNVQAQDGTKAIVRPVSLTVPSGGVSWVQIGGCATAKLTCLAVPDRVGFVLLVQSDAGAPIVAQTLTRLDGDRGTTLGAATSIGAVTPSTRWVIPRTRATGQSSTSIALTDTGVNSAHVSIEFVHGGRVDQPAALRRVTIKPGVRFVVPLADDPALQHVDAAVVVTSDVPIFAEWTIYAAHDATRAFGIPSR